MKTIKELLDNASFGDMFINENHERCVYLRMFISNGVKYYMSNGRFEFSVNEYGIVDKNLYPLASDIVSEWQEPINDEELDRFARTYISKNSIPYEPLLTIGEQIEAYKAGYRKAKKNI